MRCAMIRMENILENNSNGGQAISNSLKIDTKLIDCFLGALNTQMTKCYCKVIMFVTAHTPTHAGTNSRLFIHFSFLLSIWRSLFSINGVFLAQHLCAYLPRRWINPPPQRTNIQIKNRQFQQFTAWNFVIVESLSPFIKSISSFLFSLSGSSGRLTFYHVHVCEWIIKLISFSPLSLSRSAQLQRSGVALRSVVSIESLSKFISRCRQCD